MAFQKYVAPHPTEFDAGRFSTDKAWRLNHRNVRGPAGLGRDIHPVTIGAGEVGSTDDLTELTNSRLFLPVRGEP
jgi:hypothetical protein